MDLWYAPQQLDTVSSMVERLVELNVMDECESNIRTALLFIHNTPELQCVSDLIQRILVLPAVIAATTPVVEEELLVDEDIESSSDSDLYEDEDDTVHQQDDESSTEWEESSISQQESKSTVVTSRTETSVPPCITIPTTRSRALSTSKILSAHLIESRSPVSAKKVTPDMWNSNPQSSQSNVTIQRQRNHPEQYYHIQHYPTTTTTVNTKVFRRSSLELLSYEESTSYDNHSLCTNNNEYMGQSRFALQAIAC